MTSKDRLKALEDSTDVNGIDFVEIASADQKTLWVHFINTVAIEGTLSDVQITGGETIPTVLVTNLTALTKHINEDIYWSTDSDQRPVLTLLVEMPGDFSTYTLTLTSSSTLDLFFNKANFSFKALCPSDLDCATAPTACPPLDSVMPPIDYLAKDFQSFRKALSDFSALQYPEWQERSEADFGMMFMEALCSVADDLSYLQDRVAAEATLETATQRRSLIRHARLVDYEPRPATSALVTLQVDVTDGTTSLPVGLLVSAQGPGGEQIPFETGSGLVDAQTGKRNLATTPVNSLWNRMRNKQPNIVPYIWDVNQQCLPRGTTETWVIGQDFQFLTDKEAGQGNGMAILLDTRAQSSADPPIREIVHLVSADPVADTLYKQPLTHLVWRPEEALQYDHDISSDDDGPRTIFAGNIVPATQGQRYVEQFVIGPPPATSTQMPQAIVRTGPNNTAANPSLQYLYTLQNARMAWLAQSDQSLPPLPEVLLVQPSTVASPKATDWIWRRSLLDAETFEPAFTVDPVCFTPIISNADGSISQDYDGDDGDTLRFGDGIFGDVPEPGTIFQVTYRVGSGSLGNVAADTIVNVSSAAATSISSVTNPFAAQGGVDEESAQSVQRLAPQAFRAVQYRAVLPEDYEQAAGGLPWVLQAGTVFRWTGSWRTIFTTADPKGSETISIGQHTELINLLNRYRLAGYESYTPAPDYISLDLLITVCAQPAAFRGDVEAAILSALSTKTFPNGTTGFFYFDKFAAGTPLERSALEAAIQGAYGVAGVLSILYRQRGVTSTYVSLPQTIQVGTGDILHVDNDPSKPNSGSIKVIVEGGK